MVTAQQLATASVNPAASPANLYFRPNLSRPTIPEAVDLAPVSRVLTNFLQEKAAGDSQADLQRGRLAFQRFQDSGVAEEIQGQLKGLKPEAQREALKKELAKRVRTGEIPESANPMFQIGFTQAMARSAMSEYRANVLSRLGEVTEVMTEDGQPVPVGDPQVILQEEFAKLEGNPALASFYGQQIVTARRAAVEEEFQAQAAQRRGAAISQASREIRVQDLSSQLDQWGLAEGQIQLDVEANIRQTLSDMRDEGVADPRGHLMDALVSLPGRMDPEDALDIIDHFGSQKIAGLSLQEDSRVAISGRLDSLKRDLERRRDQDERLDYDRRVRERSENNDHGLREYSQRYEQALAAGEKLSQVFQEFRDEVLESGAYGEDAGEVITRARNYMLGLQEDVRSNVEVQEGARQMIRRGEDASDVIFQLMDAGELSPRDGAQLLNENTKNQSRAPWKADFDPYKETMGTLDSQIRVELSNLNPVVRQQFLQRYNRDLDDLRESYNALVDELVDEPNKVKKSRQLSEFLRAERNKMQNLWAQDIKEIEGNRRDALRTIDELHSRRQDARAELNSLRDAGIITEEDYDARIEANGEATDRDDLLQRTSVLTVKRRISQDIIASLGADREIEGRRAADLMNAEYEAELHAWLDTNLKDVAPAQLQRTFDAAAQSILEDRFRDRITNGDFETFREELQEEGVEAVRETLERTSLDQLQAREFFKQEASTRVPTWDPPVALDALRDTYTQFYQGKGRLFAGPITRREFDSAVHQETAELANLQGQEQVDRALSILSYRGLTHAEVMSGQIDFQLAHNRETNTRRLELLRARIAAQEATDVGRLSAEGRAALTASLSLNRQQLAKAENDVAVHRVKLKRDDLRRLNPHTTNLFADEAEAISVMTSEEASTKLMRRLGLPQEPEELISEFWRRQLELIRRRR